MTLSHHLDRTITLAAPRDVVFSFLTENARWATWWGEGSTIEPRAGGRVYARLPGNAEAGGEVIAIRAPESLSFTWGYQSGELFPPGGSRVTITLETDGPATRLHLKHECPDAASRDHHVQGWRYQLALLGNAVLDAVHADGAAKVDAWFTLWAEPDASARAKTLHDIAAPSITFRDRYSLTEGVSDLSDHIAAAQHFMPGLQLRRRGPVRHCQGTVIADWDAIRPDGVTRGQGSNVFLMGADGRIQSVTGFWGS